MHTSLLRVYLRPSLQLNIWSFTVLSLSKITVWCLGQRLDQSKPQDVSAGPHPGARSSLLRWSRAVNILPFDARASEAAMLLLRAIHSRMIYMLQLGSHVDNTTLHRDLQNQRLAGAQMYSTTRYIRLIHLYAKLVRPAMSMSSSASMPFQRSCSPATGGSSSLATS